MGQDIEEGSLLARPFIHELPLIWQDLRNLCVPIKAGHTRRQGSGVPPVCIVIYQDPDGGREERFGA